MSSKRTGVGSATAPVPLPATKVIVVRGWRRRRPVEPVVRPSGEAQRRAAAILEVLAGVRRPQDAAAALSISQPRYYLLEQRALAGLVVACEPRSDGREQGPHHQIAMLQKEVAKLTQDCARQQALVRAAQRTIGLAPPPPPKPATKVSAKAGQRVASKTTRKRRPMVRALKVAAALRDASLAQETAPASSSGASAAAVLQQAAVGDPLAAPMHSATTTAGA